MRTVPVPLLMSWLVQMDSGSLIEGISDAEEIKNSRDPPQQGLMIVLEVQSLYGVEEAGQEPRVGFVPSVGIGFVYKPPYVTAMSFS